ncbi:MAG TPA: helix-turn-helix domain-containing protein [Candidatus Limnocylindrales bacterium]|nr:helix-turn-helix domain-containing protein [Candidatus Limnocylindrales bacterium]
MRDIQAGRALRALRKRRDLSQRELADLLDLSQSTVSLAERGQLDRLALRVIRRLFEALEASAELDIRWRRGQLDALIDRRHAALVEATVRLLRRLGWLVEVETSYSVYGERGSIDILAFDPRSLTLLVVEVKSELGGIEVTIRKLDEKARLGAAVAGDRFGWRAGTVGRLLVLPATTAARRHVREHAETFEVALPLASAEVRRWLRYPIGRAAGILFVPSTNPGNQRRVSKQLGPPPRSPMSTIALERRRGTRRSPTPERSPIALVGIWRDSSRKSAE